MKKKLSPESYTDNPSTGVGILSGFGNPDSPPDYNLKKGKQKAIPREDTHPGTGLNRLDGKLNDVDAQEMLGEDE